MYLCSLSQSNELIVPFHSNGKWGYMNKKKEIVVFPKYEEAYPSYSNRYRIKLNGKYGYLNSQGELVIRPKFDRANDFKYGLASVFRNEKNYSIKPNGRKNKVGIAVCETHGSCVTPILNRNVKIIKDNGKFGFIHDKYSKNELKSKNYLPDTLQPIFDSIIPITHQLMYLVKDSLISFSHEGSYFGGVECITRELNFQYEDIKLFDCALCKEGKSKIIGVKKNGLWGYMKIELDIVSHIEFKYLNIKSLSSGFALVEYSNNKFGYIDANGNEYFNR